ncbi:hypothetical protein WDU94_010717 [Cyamophila willieti]
MAHIGQANPVIPADVTGHSVQEGEVREKPLSEEPVDKSNITIKQVEGLSIGDLITMLSVSPQTNQTIVGDLGYAGVSLAVNENQMPKTVKKVEPELEYVHDVYGRYSLFKYKQREIEPFTCYEEWLVKLMRLTLREVDDIYCMYHLEDEDVIDHVSMTSLESMGFGTDLVRSKVDTLPRLLAMLHQTRTPIAENVRYKEVTVVMHPSRRECSGTMHDMMFNVEIAPHLEWIREFMLRKRLSPMHSAEMRSGASFVAPLVELADVNLSNLSQVTGVTVTRATSIGTYLNTPINGENMKDFKSILLSWVLPTHVVLNVTCDANSYEPRKVIDCLAAKLLCSRSEGCSNITRMSALRIDEILKQYALHLGIRAPEGDGVARGNTRAAAIAAWNLIMTNPGGVGG